MKRICWKWGGSAPADSTDPQYKIENGWCTRDGDRAVSVAPAKDMCAIFVFEDGDRYYAPGLLHVDTKGVVEAKVAAQAAEHVAPKTPHQQPMKGKGKKTGKLAVACIDKDFRSP